MATVTSDAVARDESTFKSFPSGQVGYRTGSISITKTEMEDATHLMQMVPVYKGETVLGIIVDVPDMSTGTDITLDIGDGDTADRYFADSTAGQAGGILTSYGVVLPYQYTANDTIDVDIVIAATTGTTGPVTLTMHVLVA